MYPTKEQILNPPFLLFNLERDRLIGWKTSKKYHKKTDMEKIDLLEYLINSFIDDYANTLFRPISKKTIIPKVIIGQEYLFSASNNLIILDKHNPSIISTLHELAHWIHHTTWKKLIELLEAIENDSIYYPLPMSLKKEFKNYKLKTDWEFATHNPINKAELVACRWSIQLFKEVYPIAFEKLNWNKHMLYAEKENNPAENTDKHRE